MEKGDMGAAWELAYKAGGRGCGPRNRNYNSLKGEHVPLNVWSKEMATSGKEGGWLAETLSITMPKKRG